MLNQALHGQQVGVHAQALLEVLQHLQVVLNDADSQTVCRPAAGPLEGLLGDVDAAFAVEEASSPLDAEWRQLS